LKKTYYKLDTVLNKQGLEFIFSKYEETEDEVSWKNFLGSTEREITDD